MNEHVKLQPTASMHNNAAFIFEGKACRIIFRFLEVNEMLDQPESPASVAI
jgi:hypothetical protein